MDVSFSDLIFKYIVYNIICITNLILVIYFYISIELEQYIEIIFTENIVLLLFFLFYILHATTILNSKNASIYNYEDDCLYYSMIDTICLI